MVVSLGIEPRSSGWKPEIMKPLYDDTIFGVLRGVEPLLSWLMRSYLCTDRVTVTLPEHMEPTYGNAPNSPLYKSGASL